MLGGKTVITFLVDIDTYMFVYMQTYVSIYICIYLCENKLQCIICSDIHMSHNDNTWNVSHTFLIDHTLSGPGRSHAQAAKQHLLLILRPPARWATGFSGDLQHNCLLLYTMYWFCNVCMIVLEINILQLQLQLDNVHNGLRDCAAIGIDLKSYIVVNSAASYQWTS